MANLIISKKLRENPTSLLNVSYFSNGLGLQGALSILLVLIFHANEALGSNAIKPLVVLGFIPAELSHIENIVEIKSSLESVNEVILDRIIESKRFRVINEELVRQNYQSENGRRLLQNNFEIDGFIIPVIEVSADRVRVSIKYLNTELKHLIIESENFKRVDFDVSSDVNHISSADRKLLNLIYRSMNRVPYDLYVSSIQGQYITLTQGQSHGLRLGDIISLKRIVDVDFHPVDGTWIRFKEGVVGDVKIAELKENNAVAQILSGYAPEAINIGDGAQNPRLINRSYFESNAFKNQSQLVTQEKVKIIDKPMNPRQDIVEGEPIDDKQFESNVGQNNRVVDLPGQKNAVVEDESLFEPGSLGEMMSSLFNMAEMRAGAHTWSYGGGPEASGSFPLWVFNQFGLTLERPFLPKIGLELGGDFIFGGTGSGKYMGITGMGRLLYRDAFTVPMWGFFDSYYFGGHGSYTGLSVTNDSFGGGDFLMGGILGGAQFDWFVGNFGRKIESYVEIALNPLTIGRIGYAGTRHSIKSMFGWEFNFGGWFEKDPNVFWGGHLKFASNSYLLENSKEVSNSTFSLLGSIKWELK